MENPLNERIVEIQKYMKLTDVEFCSGSKISTGTLFHIKNDRNVSSKTIEAICNGFNVNREWLVNGVGEMLIITPESSVKVADTLWKDEAYLAMKRHSEFLEKEVEWLRGLVSKFSGAPNFLNAVVLARKKGFTNPISDNSVRVAA